MEAALDVFIVNVGYTQKFQGIADLANFLRSILDDDRFNKLRSCWLTKGQPIGEQTSKLIHAEPSGELADSDSYQLSEFKLELSEDLRD